MHELWQEFFEHLHFLGMDDENFLKFLEGKIRRYSLPWNSFGWGVFPKLDDEGRIIDIRMLVPDICDEKTLLINIHEYTHAFDLYNALNTLDDSSKDEEYERRAKSAEYKVLERRMNIMVKS